MSKYPTNEVYRNNLYYDKTGTEILVGDLLKVYHYGSGSRTRYMYLVVVMEEADFPVMACSGYDDPQPHCRMLACVNKETRIFEGAKIIYSMDWETKRKKIKP